MVSIHALSLLEGLDTEKYLAFWVDFHKFARCIKYEVHNDVMIIYFSESVGRIHNFRPVEGGVEAYF